MRKKPIGPKDLYYWTLAVYPGAVLVGIGFLFVTDKQVTTEIVGLFIGLLTAGTLKAALNLNEKEGKDDTHDTGGRDDRPSDIRQDGDKTLGPEDRRRPDDTDNRFSILDGFRFDFLY